jgi:hypothetical protein
VIPASLHRAVAPALLAALLGVALALGACSLQPTPYQPLGEAGGYEESRLQERVYRVSFRGNRATAETDVLDFVYLRSAELTRQSGFSHFVIQEDFGRTQYTARPSPPRASTGVTVLGSGKRSFWAVNVTAPLGEPDYDVVVSYHLAVFVVRMLTPEEARAAGDAAYEAEYLLRSLAPKREASLRAAD